MLDFEKKEKIFFYLQDEKKQGYKGDCIASALHALGVKKLSSSQRYNRPRGFFCGIGKCSSCLMRVNGVPNVRTCIAPLKKDIKVEFQDRKEADLPDAEFEEKPVEKIDVDVLVVGAGPAGLSAGIEAAENNASVLLVDENQQIGGQLIKQTHKFFGSKQEKAGTRGIKISKILGEKVEQLRDDEKIDLMLDATVIGNYESNDEKFRFGVIKRINYHNRLFEVSCKAVIFAMGAMENMLVFPGNDLPGVYGAGAVQTLMNVYGVKPGKKVVMVGAGNVGLIVAYQLLQAGIDVECVVEAASFIGGYHVHAAKLRRCGVPIFTSHSIKEVYGDGMVEGAVTVKLDGNWNPIDGTEQDIECDTVCLAVGLTPSIRLLGQTGVRLEDISEAGGQVAIHDMDMQTSVDNVFVAGDCSGIEEASTAMIEGKIAGISAAEKIGYKIKKEKKQKYHKELQGLRAGPFGEKPRMAKQKIKKIRKKIEEK